MGHGTGDSLVVRALYGIVGLFSGQMSWLRVMRSNLGHGDI